MKIESRVRDYWLVARNKKDEGVIKRTSATNGGCRWTPWPLSGEAVSNTHKSEPGQPAQARKQGSKGARRQGTGLYCVGSKIPTLKCHGHGPKVRGAIYIPLGMARGLRRKGTVAIVTILGVAVILVASMANVGVRVPLSSECLVELGLNFVPNLLKEGSEAHGCELLAAGDEGCCDGVSLARVRGSKTGQVVGWEDGKWERGVIFGVGSS